MKSVVAFLVDQTSELRLPVKTSARQYPEKVTQRSTTSKRKRLRLILADIMSRNRYENVWFDVDVGVDVDVDVRDTVGVTMHQRGVKYRFIGYVY